MSKVPVPPANTEGEQVEELTKTIEKDTENARNEARKKDNLDIAEQVAGMQDEKLRSMGFVTAKDMNDKYTELKAENNELRLKMDKLTELLTRKKAQGKAGIPSEEKKTDEDELKDIYVNVGQWD